jgi:hypothetical protein
MSFINNIIKEEIRIKNLSDLGSNWSARHHTLKDGGFKPYTKKGYKFIPVDENKTIPTDSVYLKPSDVDEINELGETIFSLLNKQKTLIDLKSR